jgi:hypothetical protein
VTPSRGIGLFFVVACLGGGALAPIHPSGTLQASLAAVGIAHANTSTHAVSTVSCADKAATDSATLQAGIDADYFGTLHIAAGTCQLDRARLTVAKPIVIDGAGQFATYLIQGSGIGGFNIYPAADPTTVENLNLNSATNNPGPCSDKNGVVIQAQPGVLFSLASHTTVRDITATIGCGFGIRITGSNPCDAYPTTGTIVNDLNVSNTGGGGFASLDIDCTDGATLSNITVHGNFVALYIDENVTLTNERYLPVSYHKVSEACRPPWYITGPADNIAIHGIQGGGPGPIRLRATNISVEHQTPTLGC